MAVPPRGEVGQDVNTTWQIGAGTAFDGPSPFAFLWRIGPRRRRTSNPLGMIASVTEFIRESVGPSTRPRFPRPRGMATQGQLDEQLRRARDRTREWGQKVEPEYIPRADKPPSPNKPRVFEEGVLKDVPGIQAGRVATRTGESSTSRTPSTRRFKPIRGDLAGAWTFLGDTLYQEASRRLDAEWRRRIILRTNRRGALASRRAPGSPGTTNRTGAKSTRPYQPIPTTPVNPTAIPGIAGPTVDTRSAPSGDARRDSAPVSRDAEARRIMERSPAMPRSVPRVQTKPKANAQTRTWIENFLLRQTFPQSRVRGQSRTQTRRQVDTETAFATQVLTGSNTATLVLSQPQLSLATLTGSKTATSTSRKQKECECDEPKRKQTSPRCRNPVVSKQRRGDLLTITRRIQCPPSR